MSIYEGIGFRGYPWKALVIETGKPLLVPGQDEAGVSSISSNAW